MPQKSSIISSGNHLFAPNGKPTNLTADDYAFARSGPFKRIVGDWESARIIRQARTAWSDEKSKNRTNFIPSEGFIEAVRDLVGLDIRLVVITDDAIRHIKSKHSQGEELRGQINITPEDIATIPYAINNFDSIERSPEYDGNRGELALTVKKRVNGITYVGIINKGQRNEVIISTWRRKMSVALDASVKETPGLNVQDDTDLIAKIKRDIEKIKQSAENITVAFDENGEPTAECIAIARQIDALETLAAHEENRGLFESDYSKTASLKVTQIDKEIAGLRQRLTVLSKDRDNLVLEKASIEAVRRALSKEDETKLLSSLKDVLMDKSVPLLVNITGRFYAGATAGALLMDSRERGVAPVYMSKEQAKLAGLTISGKGCPVIFKDGDKVSRTKVYSIDDTNLKQLYPEYNEALVEKYEAIPMSWGNALKDYLVQSISQEGDKQTTGREDKTVKAVGEVPLSRLSSRVIDVMRELVNRGVIPDRAWTSAELESIVKEKTVEASVDVSAEQSKGK